MSERYKLIIPGIDFWKELVPCQAACPVHTDSGRYVQSIAEGDVRSAYLTARAPNPFASVCGRVCAAPCEDRCRRGKIDAPVSIRALKRYATERFGVESLQPNTIEEILAGNPEPGNKWAWHASATRERSREWHGKRVAVIGAGPAGLSCAHDLALAGLEVTVFEASNLPGGMLRYGIPEYRLIRALIDKEVDRILDLGATIRYNTPLTADFGIAQLREQGYDAVFVSVGTQRGRDLNIEGSNLDGVIKAVDYLLNINNGYRVSLGKRVLVIGGGFVAFDAARTALRGDLDGTDHHTAVDAARMAMRVGAEEVHIASLESFEEMPVLRTSQGHEEFEEAIREGIQFHPQRGPKRFVGSGGKVSAAEFIGVKRTYDPDGRFNPQFDESLVQTLPVDSIILAIGQQTDLSFVKPADGIDLTPSNLFKINPQTLATSAPGIYAGGDAAFGPRNIIDAVANGKQAALSIQQFLHAAPRRTQFHFDFEKLPISTYTRPEAFEQIPRVAPPTIDINRRTGISEVEEGYLPAEAVKQAERCLACHIQTIYDAEKCVMCNRCVDVCPEFCLKLVPIGDLDMSESEKAELLSHYHLAEGEVASAMIKDDDRCIRCGLCAIRCPTDAMTMELFYHEEQLV